MQNDLSVQKILLQTKAETNIQTKTNTKTEKDPPCATFLKSRHFKDVKCDTERGVATKSES